jgi:pimeloyl-ACP methyl ester carboxylesterase
MATMKQTESVPNPAEQRGGEPITSDHAEIQLEGGTVRYRDLGRGDPIVFVHGLLVDGRLWDGVAERVAADGHRAIVPDWPMGSHVIPMNGDADLSPPGQAKLVADLIEPLALERATMRASPAA